MALHITKKFGMILTVLIVVPLCVQAERLGIAVNENKIAFDIDAGEEQTFVVKVTNVSDIEQKITIDAMDYDVADDNRITLRADADEQNGVKEWIEPVEKEFTLQPNAGKDVTFYVHVPDTAGVGSHRGAVILRILSADDSQVKVQGQIGVHVLINVKGDTHATGVLRSFDVPLIAVKQVAYHATFENTGNIHYVPHGDVTVRNVITSKRMAYDLNEGDHFVLPGKKFSFDTAQEIPSPFGVYFVKARFVDGEGMVQQKNKLMIGYLFPLAIIVLVGGAVWYRAKVRKKRAHA